MKLKYWINFHKGFTFVYILIMMAVYKQWENSTAWIYLALHGSYGILWVLKSLNFPDKKWEQWKGYVYAIAGMGGLSLYLIAPWMLISRGVLAPGWYIGLCVFMYLVGIFFHFASDMQKYMALQSEPNRLWTQGLWRYSRNPNYFGELLTYLGFGLLAMHWLPVTILAIWVTFFWLPNMRIKDRSLSRYAEFEDYRKRTRFFIPFII